MRIRLEGVPHRYHEDHITAKGLNSIIHYSLAHKFIPMPQAMKIPDAKAAVEKEWEKLERIPSWQLTKVRNEKEVVDEARNKGRKVHFATFMDICHLKNSELEPQYQKYKGRVVIRGDIVKDDSGSCPAGLSLSSQRVRLMLITSTQGSVSRSCWVVFFSQSA